jgi:hypothetical protein
VSRFLNGIAIERGFPPLATELLSVLLVVAVIVSVLIHEWGHRLTGMALGWRCVRFGFGPFEFYREKRTWKVHKVKMVWGAFVRQVPADYSAFRLQKSATLLSGPLSSLVSGLFFTILAMLSANALAFRSFGLLGLVCLMGVLELIPREKNGIGTDGYRLWQVIRGGPPIDDMIREIACESSNLHSPRWRDWPREVIVRLAAGDDPFNIYLAYLHHSDAGDWEAAGSYMRRLIAVLPEVNPNAYYACEAAYWCAAREGDPESARKWLARAGSKIADENRRRAAAALALAQNQFERAILLADQAIAEIGTPICGSDECEIYQLRYVLSQAAESAAGVLNFAAKA